MATAPTLENEIAQRDPKAPVVVFENVSMGWENNQVLKDISFVVQPGETRLLLGPCRQRQERTDETGRPA